MWFPSSITPPEPFDAVGAAKAQEPKRSGNIADDSESIARRLKELEADRQLALTGSSAPEQPKEAETRYGEYAMGYRVRL